MASILVTGARDWTNVDRVRQVLESNTQFNPIIIHGDCKGVDRICGNVGESLGFEIRARPADWRLGRCAGVIRNSSMIEELLQLQLSEYRTCVLTFHDALDHSRGTKDCVKKALKAGLTVYSISSTEIKHISTL